MTLYTERWANYHAALCTTSRSTGAGPAANSQYGRVARSPEHRLIGRPMPAPRPAVQACALEVVQDERGCVSPAHDVQSLIPVNQRDLQVARADRLHCRGKV